MKKEAIVIAIGLCIIASIAVITAVSAINLNRDFKNASRSYNPSEYERLGDAGSPVSVFSDSGLNGQGAEPTKGKIFEHDEGMRAAAIKNDFNGSLSFNSLNLPLSADKIKIIGEKIKIEDALGYNFDISTNADVEGFDGDILLKGGHLYLTGSIKSIRTNDAAINLKAENTAIVEVISGSITVESAKVESFSTIATGSVKLSKKMDIKLANDEVSIKKFEGKFQLNSSGSAELYGQVRSMTADGQSFTVLVK